MMRRRSHVPEQAALAEPAVPARRSLGLLDAGCTPDEVVGLLERALDAIPCGVIVTDPAQTDNPIVYVNAGFASTTGYRPEEVLGRNCRVLQGDAPDKAVNAVRDAVAAQAGIDVVLRNYRRDGSPFWNELAIRPVPAADGRTTYFIGVQNDVTQRIEAERLAATALQTLREREALLDAAHNGILIVDAVDDLRILYASAAVERLLGRPPGTLLGQPARGRVLPLDDDPAGPSGWQADPLHPSSVVYAARRPDGARQWLRVDATPIRDADGHLSRLVLVQTDYNDRVRSRRRRAVLNARLRAASHRAGMAEVATGVLHNVGNVLTSLGVSVAAMRELLEHSRLPLVVRIAEDLDARGDDAARYIAGDTLGRELPGYFAGALRRMQREHERLLEELESITKQVDLVRRVVTAQQGTVRLRATRDPVDVEAVLESAIIIATSGVPRLDIERNYQPLPTCLLDADKLTQIVLNLLANAVHAVQGCNDRTPWIRVTTAATPGRLSVRVDDNGSGIDADKLPGLFEFGYTSRPEGNGFGLHNSANLAHQMDGTIVATSDGAGKGASFRLELPLETAEMTETLP